MRPHVHEYYMQMAAMVAKRSSCIRNQVGCILTNARDEVLSTGYNGNPRGFVHCIDSECKVKPGETAYLSPSCLSVHAEQNALLQCTNIDNIVTCYVTKFPCMTCLKMLLNTTCSCIIYGEDSKNIEEGLKLWKLKSCVAYKLIPGSLLP